ncbi:glycosyltransferase family 2 protein [Flavobacterium sp. NRK F10]|uniref:glycosyltransferase family 2 protein n=1 Tax=Flavobacterium sp. NRK F10 TaxID=2954931 RepID=UPI0020917DBE|nr:glycosyltransferase family 2 protein [Flavobacterium sp. NRK F10]MCO6173802.1 glycosyltransferase family 2 protein [Flavobacterium sp. NRK F10]
MNLFPKCTLIASTYNWPSALELLLLSVLRQSHLPDEVIIADDGSNEDTALLIQKFQKKFPVPLLHVWQEDNGFQKATILNKAIAQSKYEYIIQIDGDIIMHQHFIKDHLTYALDNHYLFGSRSNIQEKALNRVLTHKIIDFSPFSKGIKKRTRTIRFPFLMNFIKTTSKRSKKLRGCNVSFWKKDFIAINGYNEKFNGWGMEDSELIERFHNAGIKGRRLKNVAIAYHIYHKELKKDRVTINQSIEDETALKKIKFTEKGIDQYLQVKL